MKGHAKIQSLYEACAIVEGFSDRTDVTADVELQAWGFIVKSGACRTLQGWYGRTAAALIDAGLLTANGDVVQSATAIQLN